MPRDNTKSCKHCGQPFATKAEKDLHAKRCKAYVAYYLRTCFATLLTFAISEEETGTVISKAALAYTSRKVPWEITFAWSSTYSTYVVRHVTNSDASGSEDDGVRFCQLCHTWFRSSYHTTQHIYKAHTNYVWRCQGPHVDRSVKCEFRGFVSRSAIALPTCN